MKNKNYILKPKLHAKTRNFLHKSSLYGEEMLLDHPLLVGLMQWKWSFIGPWKTLIDLMRPWRTEFQNDMIDIDFMDCV